MERKMIRTEHAPEAIGPYAQASQCGEWMFLSGQIALTADPSRDELKGDIRVQTRQVLSNLRAVLQAGGLDLGHVVKTTVYMTDLGEFQAMNVVYAEYFPVDPPARATVQAAALPRGARIEIDAIAVRR